MHLNFQDAFHANAEYYFFLIVFCDGFSSFSALYCLFFVKFRIFDFEFIVFVRLLSKLRLSNCAAVYEI